MEFTLVHRGLLKANGDARDKHTIRRALHRQLSELWKHPPLRNRAETLLADPPVPAKVSLIRNVGAFRFAPIVSSRIGLFAEIGITLLRPHLPGALIAEGGDIDNRVKTLLDALRMPTNASEIPVGDVPLQDETPFFCLLEDDGLVSALSISTDRLLEPGLSASEALIIMRVRTKTFSMPMRALIFANGRRTLRSSGRPTAALRLPVGYPRACGPRRPLSFSGWASCIEDCAAETAS